MSMMYEARESRFQLGCITPHPYDPGHPLIHVTDVRSMYNSRGRSLTYYKDSVHFCFSLFLVFEQLIVPYLSMNLFSPF
jgi:hypothetical protein